jgi:hypothetical protein
MMKERGETSSKREGLLRRKVWAGQGEARGIMQANHPPGLAEGRRARLSRLQQSRQVAGIDGDGCQSPCETAREAWRACVCAYIVCTMCVMEEGGGGF